MVKKSLISKLLVLLFFIGVGFGCQKDESTNPGGSSSDPCVKFHRGDFEVVNTNDSPYKIYMDGSVWGDVGSNNSKKFTDKSSGSYSFKAVQISGYIFFPTEYTGSYEISDCQKTVVTLN